MPRTARLLAGAALALALGFPLAACAPTTPAATTAAAKASSAAPATSTSSAAAAKALTLAEVKQHNSAASCWTVINKTVYDLTAWVSAHPGGPQRILATCGVDATDQFTAEHGSKKTPNARLDTFKLGPLS